MIAKPLSSSDDGKNSPHAAMGDVKQTSQKQNKMNKTTIENKQRMKLKCRNEKANKPNNKTTALPNSNQVQKNGRGVIDIKQKLQEETKPIILNKHERARINLILKLVAHIFMLQNGYYPAGKSGIKKKITDPKTFYSSVDEGKGHVALIRDILRGTTRGLPKNKNYDYKLSADVFKTGTSFLDSEPELGIPLGTFETVLSKLADTLNENITFRPDWRHVSYESSSKSN